MAFDNLNTSFIALTFFILISVPLLFLCVLVYFAQTPLFKGHDPTTQSSLCNSYDKFDLENPISIPPTAALCICL